MTHLSPLTLVAVGCAAVSACILVLYLVRRPILGQATKIWLALGLGVFPIAAAAAGNVEGYERTKARSFCGSCHVMTLHSGDSDDPNSTSLAARHARNASFGAENCYACHSDYGMFGTVTTKLGGMRHVWLYYTEYLHTPIEEAKKTIVIRKPFPNASCMQCHSTRNEIWNRVPDHKAMLTELRAGSISCGSSGCHGLAHPFFTQPGAEAPKPVPSASGGAR